jgi:hypothetical protein
LFRTRPDALGHGLGFAAGGLHGERGIVEEWTRLRRRERIGEDENWETLIAQEKG